MTRTQIQSPDEVYARAKRLCEVGEISLAELAGRGIEYILSVCAPVAAGSEEWHVPKPRDLDRKNAHHLGQRIA
jgi:tagatose-1,6-bisphosphate aldolase non-catalytic subunit AgaZ/GatZ